MQKYFRRGICDRSDGWRVTKVDAVYNLIPYIMRTRMDSQNLFEENIPLDPIESFIREHREDMPDLSVMQVIMAATVRLLSQRPYLNRFVIWNKIYARNHIKISLMIKRKQSNEETTIIPEFEPDATLYDVMDKISSEVNKNIAEGVKNGTDNTTGAFGRLPPFLVRFAVWMLFKLDALGLLPKALTNVSPFHTSVFITNVGSLGIGPIYHHLYEFGTCSMFIAMGSKHKVRTLSGESDRGDHRFIGLKFVTDERICDGQYYAYSMRVFRRLLANPAQLLVPPEHVVVDDGVGKRRIDLPCDSKGKEKKENADD